MIASDYFGTRKIESPNQSLVEVDSLINLMELQSVSEV